MSHVMEATETQLTFYSNIYVKQKKYISVVKIGVLHETNLRYFLIRNIDEFARKKLMSFKCIDFL